MTEQQWLASNDPQHLLHWFRGTESGADSGRGEEVTLCDRKLRLFAVACCRQVWHLLTDKRSRWAVESAEKYADQLLTADKLVAAWAEAWAARVFAQGGAAGAAAEAAAWAAAGIARGVAGEDAARAAAQAAARAAGDGAWDAQTALLRDIFGNPWWPVRWTRPWFAWHDGLIPRMAQQIYNSRDFGAMPILADALEEAGCTNEDILTHCRQDGLHVRGCWVIDLILSKDC
jgi:hypothetical protein